MSEFIVNIRSFLLSPISTYTNTDHCLGSRAQHVSSGLEKGTIISTSVSVASAWPGLKNLLPLEAMGDRSFSPAQARERASARRGPLRVTAPNVAARTGSARKLIADRRLEGSCGS